MCADAPQTEMHLEGVCERFGILLDVYLCHCGMHRHQLWRQYRVNKMFEEVAVGALRLSKSERDDYARAELRRVAQRLPDRFQLCLSPKYVPRSPCLRRVCPCILHTDGGVGGGRWQDGGGWAGCGRVQGHELQTGAVVAHPNKR